MRGDFLTYISTVAKEFVTLSQNKQGPIKIVGNLDTDGVTSTAILTKTLARLGLTFSVSLVHQITEPLLHILAKEPYETIFFVDLGSGSLEHLRDTLQKDVYVLDHHYPQISEKTIGTIRQVNPHLFDIDGTKLVSAAGVTYFFAKALDERNIDLAYLALIGAIGDVQENMGFAGLNELILADAQSHGDVLVKESIRLYGMQTKPVHKVLEYSTNPYIPGVTGNEKGAIRFVESTGIKIKNDGAYRSLSSLSKEEVAVLLEAITTKKTSTSDEPHIGPVFLLQHEPDTSIKKDLREFSTLLNACARMDKPTLGVGACFQDVRATQQALSILRDYRKEILDAIRWFYTHKKTDKVKEGNGYAIILAEQHIRDTIIATVASILSKSKVYPDGTIIMGVAYTLDGNIKSSFRVSGTSSRTTDLRLIVKNILAKGIKGYGGGHRLAAGAVIPQEQEEAFLEATLSVLDSDAVPLEETP